MAVDANQEYVGETPVGEALVNEMPTSNTGETKPEVPEARQANVKRILADVKAAKKHWKGDFNRMREDVYFSQGNHWPDAMPGLEDPRLVIDITSRHLQLRQAALYAKNPTVVAKRRDTIDFLVWDETPESAVKAQETLAMAATPEAQALVQGGDGALAVQFADAATLLEDIKEGMERRQAMDRLGKTCELVFRDQMQQSNPPFKTQMKTMIPRALTTNVGYVKLDYQRTTGRKPGQETRLCDARDQLAELQRRIREWNDERDDTYAKTRAEFDELELEVAALEAAKPVVLKEGLLFQFPRSWAIIPDKKCTNLVGFTGSDWVAEEMEMSPEDIEATYGKKIGGDYVRYNKQADGQIVESKQTGDDTVCYACVYIVYNRRTQMVYIVCDGYDDFLQEPAAPEIYFPSFFPWFAFVPNQSENARGPFTKSDVRLIAPLQRELNRSMEALRAHRIANQPKYMHDAAAFEEDEVINLQNTPAHESIPVKMLGEGRKLADVIQAVPKVELDPNIYSVDVIYQALGRVVGTQEANLGQPDKTDRTTATSATIAEASRLSSQQSNADDLDDVLSLVAKNAGYVLLTQMGEEQVKKIAGRGSIWTQLSREEAANEIYLEIVAGSSGRPNQAQEVAVMKDIMPLLFQIPGMSPQKIAEELIKVMNSRLKPSDMMDPAITQSIMAMGRGAGQQMGANPANDPASQGAEGDQNAPKNTPQTENQTGGIQSVAA